MAYTIIRSNGSVFQEIEESNIDNTKYSVGLIGKNTINYGKTFVEDQIHMLENFANYTSPIRPIPGQIWFDSGTSYIRYNTGSVDDENTWTKIVSANLSNNIGTDIDAYETFYLTNINDPAYVGANTTNIFSTNIGSATDPISNSFFDIIGSSAVPTTQLVVTNINTVNTIGTTSIPTNEMYANFIGSTTSRVNTLYANDINGINIDATELGGQLPSYYLDYNNFTNVPNYASQFVDVVGDTMTGDLTMYGVSSLILDHDPVANNEVATKQYIDILSSGLDHKNSCRAATTTNITLSGTQTIDGVSLLVGDRVLVKNQSTASQNGIYDVAAGVWSRSEDADGSPSNEVTSGMSTFVSNGLINASTGWVLTTSDPITVGSTALSFSQTSIVNYYSTGPGLKLIGNALSADFGTSAGTTSEGNHVHSLATASVTGFMSASDKTKLDGIASGAEVNQNTFSNIAVSGQNTIVADSETDILTFVAGNGISITTDSGSDSMTITNTSINTTQTIVAGTGLSGGGSGAVVNLDNTDLGSSHNIFKTIDANTGSLSASSNNSTVNFTGTNGLTVTGAGNTITFDGSGLLAAHPAIVDSSLTGGSFTSTGYVTFAGGLTFQWGRVDNGPLPVSGYFTFAVSMDWLYAITASPDNPSSANVYAWFAYTNYLQPGPHVSSTLNTSGGTGKFSWMAIGHRNGF